MALVDETIEDRIGKGGFPEVGVPGVYRQLARDPLQARAAQQACAALVVAVEPLTLNIGWIAILGGAPLRRPIKTGDLKHLGPRAAALLPKAVRTNPFAVGRPFEFQHDPRVVGGIAAHGSRQLGH